MAFVPPQTVPPGASQWDCSLAGFDPPSEEFRLAGSLLSLSDATIDHAAAAVSPIDGVHFVADPRRRWLSIQAFLCVDRAVVPVSPDQLVSDGGEAHVNALLPRISWADDL